MPALVEIFGDDACLQFGGGRKTRRAAGVHELHDAQDSQYLRLAVLQAFMSHMMRKAAST